VKIRHQKSLTKPLNFNPIPMSLPCVLVKNFLYTYRFILATLQSLRFLSCLAALSSTLQIGNETKNLLKAATDSLVGSMFTNHLIIDCLKCKSLKHYFSKTKTIKLGHDSQQSCGHRFNWAMLMSRNGSHVITRATEWRPQYAK
jgi:hypothetical protein